MTKLMLCSTSRKVTPCRLSLRMCSLILARIARDEAGHQVEDRRLPGAVRTNQPGDAPVGDGQRAAIDRDHAAEPLGERRDLQQAHQDTTVRARRRLRSSAAEGTMPRGSSRMTSRNTAE